MANDLVRHPYYLGQRGRFLTIRGPNRGYSPAPDLGLTLHRTVSGALRAQRPPYAPRLIKCEWPHLSDAEKTWLEQCATGLVPGPLYWVDPLVKNQMPPRISAPTAPVAAGDYTAPGTLQYRPDGSQGFGGVDWIPTAAGSELTPMVRVPYVAGLPFTASVYITRYTSTSTTVSLNIDWFDAAGTQLARTSGNGVALAVLAGGYQLTVTTSSPPAGAVEGRLSLYATNARTFRVDSWQVEYGILSTFATGPGLARVIFTEYNPDVYMAGRTSVQAAMAEV